MALKLISASCDLLTREDQNAQLATESERGVLEALAQRNQEYLAYHHASACDVAKVMNVLRGMDCVEGEPDIFHFLGHGFQDLQQRDERFGTLRMPLRLGGMDGFRGELTQELYEHGPLVSVFRDVVQVQGKCRLIVLQACSVYALAERIVESCPGAIVIGWSTMVLNSACSDFSHHFYTSLFDLYRSRHKCLLAVDVFRSFKLACALLVHEVRRLGYVCGWVGGV
jgi:hypothetical protein